MKSAGSPVKTGTGPFGVLVDSTGSYVYVSNRTAATISGFLLSNTGALTPITGSPFSTGTLPELMVEDKTDTYIAVICAGGGPDLQVFKFDATTAGRPGQRRHRQNRHRPHEAHRPRRHALKLTSGIVIRRAESASGSQLPCFANVIPPTGPIAPGLAYFLHPSSCSTGPCVAAVGAAATGASPIRSENPHSIAFSASAV